MNEDERESNLCRRDFLKGGSAATVMTMLGGAQLFGGTESSSDEEKSYGPRIKVGLIGLGAWGGRDLISSVARVPQADIAAICDIYPAAIKRCGDAAPGAVRTEKYQSILEDKDIKAVLVATPTHLHKEIVLAALKAGKHVYCEAPLANTIEDAREIARAAQDATQLVFQAGLQLRSDKERTFLWPFIQSGALGRTLMVRAQWHKKQSWRVASPNAEREKAINWRLNKADSLGLVGEIGIHQIDQAAWFLASRPVAMCGFGSVLRWTEDGREVDDTVQLLLEFPGGVNMIFDATLGNSYDSSYEVFYGDAAAVMLRDETAWLFKEADAPLFGWEGYAAKTKFLDEVGIALVAGASKSVSSGAPTPEEVFKASPLFNALDHFIRNAADVTSAVEDTKAAYGDDPALIREAIAKVRHRAAAGHREGFQATVTVIKAKEAIETRQRVILKPELYELA